MDHKPTSLFPELEQRAPTTGETNGGFTTGVLPSQKIEDLIRTGSLFAAAAIEPGQLQPASIDLRLGPIGYRVRASVLPGENAMVMQKIDDLLMHEVDLCRPAVLEKGCVYIVPLLEEVNLPRGISGKANPKSTTGRLDVFTRLITDGGTEFERVKAGYKGKLYVEIVPRTFSVVVRAGTKLNQLRFIRGTPPPSDAKLDQLHQKETLVYLGSHPLAEPVISKGLWISIDLRGTAQEIVGYRARSHAPLIDLEKIGYYDPLEFWEPIPRPPTNGVILNPDDFYILVSREKIRVPPDYAAEMVAYDPSVGEFRIHYAGFFDPGFGYGRDDIKGTPAVLEVRSHEVPFLLEDGQIVGRLIYERLLALPDKIYGQGIGSSYQSQSLSLSKQFRRC